LEAQRFTTPSGHDGKDILSVEYRIYDISLAGPKFVKSKNFTQKRFGAYHWEACRLCSLLDNTVSHRVMVETSP
jgi:hypothetical protein